MENNETFLRTFNEAKKRLENLPIYSENFQVKIEFVDNRFLFKFQGFFLDNIALNLFDKIVIDHTISTTSSEIKTEIMHEVIHTLQAKKYGGWIVSRLKIPDWVLEGYAVYISRENLTDGQQKFLQYCFNHNKLSTPDWYRLVGLMVKHAIEQMHYSVDDLHRGKVDYDTVYKDMMKRYKDK